MAKSQDAKKGSKKPAMKSPKEKKAAKVAKKVANSPHSATPMPK